MTWDGQDRRLADINVAEKLDKLVDTLNDVKERVVRMETRQEESFKRAEKTEQMAYDAERKANEALLHCRDNERDLDVIKADFETKLTTLRTTLDDKIKVYQWVLGGIVTVCIGIATIYFQGKN